jgi:hypothetical protein
VVVVVRGGFAGGGWVLLGAGVRRERRRPTRAEWAAITSARPARIERSE